MLTFVIWLSTCILGIALVLNTARLMKGPSMPDRVLALDTLYINALALIIMICIRLNTNLVFEAALLIAALGFISTTAVAKHLLHGDIID